MNAPHRQPGEDAAVSEDEQSLSRSQFVVIILGLLSTAIGQSLIFAILPPLGRTVGFNELQTNAIISASALVFAVSSPWWGRLSDRVGRKPIMLTGLIGYGVGTLAFTAVFAVGLRGEFVGLPLFITAITVRCLQAAIMSASNPGAAAYAADHSSRKLRTQTLARLGTATSMGMIVGPVFAGLLAGFGLLVPLYAAAALAGTASVLVWQLLPRSIHTFGKRPYAANRVSVFDPRIMLYLVCSFGGFVGFSGIQQTLGYRIMDTLALSSQETAQYTGIALMVSAFCTFTMQMTIAQRFTGPPLYLIRSGLASLVIGSLVIASAGGYLGVCFGMAFMGTGLGLLVPAVASAASLAVTPEEQGAAAGLVTACPAAGFVVGPVAAGGLYRIDPVLAPLAAAAVLSTVLAYAVIRGRRLR